MKHIIRNFVLTILLSSCSYKIGDPTECVKFNNDAPVKLIDIGHLLSKENKLELQDFESSTTTRQKAAGKQTFMIHGENIHFFLDRGEEGTTTICGYDETDGEAASKVRQIISRLRKHLESLNVTFTSSAD